MNNRLPHNPTARRSRRTTKALGLLPFLLLIDAGRLAAGQQQIYLDGNWGEGSPANSNTTFVALTEDTYTTRVSVGGLGLSMSALVQPGILSASISGSGHWFTTANSAPDHWWFSGGSGQAQVASEESLTLSVPGLSGGEAVNLTFSYYVPGQLTASFSGKANVVAQYLWQSTGAAFRIDRLESHVPENNPVDVSVDTLPPGRVYSVTRTVVAGSPFLEGHLLQVTGVSTPPGVDTDGSSSFNIDFASYWNGVSQVTVDGVPVTGYSLVNENGVDFTGSFAPAVVPEPEQYAALVAAGLLALGVWRRTARTEA